MPVNMGIFYLLVYILTRLSGMGTYCINLSICISLILQLHMDGYDEKDDMIAKGRDIIVPELILQQQ